MITAEKSAITTKRERRQWFVTLAFGVLDEAVVALPMPPTPVVSDVLP